MVDLLVLSSSYQLLFILNVYFDLFTNQPIFISAELSPSRRVPCSNNGIFCQRYWLQKITQHDLITIVKIVKIQA
jgi:hypothetical protein